MYFCCPNKYLTCVSPIVLPTSGVESGGGTHQAVAATQTTPDPKKPAPTPAPAPAPAPKVKKQSRYQLQQRLQSVAAPTASPPHCQLDTSTSRESHWWLSFHAFTS